MTCASKKSASCVVEALSAVNTCKMMKAHFPVRPSRSAGGPNSGRAPESDCRPAMWQSVGREYTSNIRRRPFWPPTPGLAHCGQRLVQTVGNDWSEQRSTTGPNSCPNSGQLGELKGAEGGFRGTEGVFRGTEGGLRVTEGELRGTEGGLRVTESVFRGTEGGLRVTEGELRGTEGGLRVTEGELRGTKGGLRVTEGELRGTEGGLRVTEGELRGTEGGLKGTEGELSGTEEDD
eukprot:4917671-Pyramimonas_sp.AAC.2